MKTIRLLYPDYVSGGLDTYYFGANLLAHILPENKNQPLIKVDIAQPNSANKIITDGIYAKGEVLSGIQNAMAKIEKENPDKIITIGGNCLVSLAPFDYLHGKYKNTGIVWIDAHPDVSSPKDGYPNAHAMVLGSLMGYGDNSLSNMMKNNKFNPDEILEILYVGLQNLHDYQKNFLNNTGVNYKIQTNKFISNNEIHKFIKRFDHILVHFDIDVLDEHFFHSTYFANSELVGDGADGGKMTIEKLTEILRCITDNSDIVGFTIAEYLPFDEHKLYKMLTEIKLFTE
jgi:arginase